MVAPGADLDRLAVELEGEPRSRRRQRLNERGDRAPPDQLDHRGGGERREQDAVAVVADGRDDTVERVHPMRGVLSGVAGRRPVAVSSSSSSSTPGTIARASHSSSCTAPARTAASAPRSSTVAPTTTEPSRRGTRYTERPCTRPRTVRAAADGRRGVGRPEAQDVPLDGAEGGEPRPGEPVDGAQARAGRQDDVVRAEAAAVRQDERGPVFERGDAALDERHPAAAAGLGERSEERPVVDLVVAGDLDAAAQGGAERGDEAAAFAGAAAVRLEAERVLVGEEVVEAGAIGRIERDRDRARRVVADVVTGGLLQRGGEGGPAPGARPPAAR